MEKSPLYSRLEVLASFLEKGKVLAITEETREERNLMERGTNGNQGVNSVAHEDPTRAQKVVISRAPPSSPTCSRAVPWSKHLFSPSYIPQLDGSESFSSEKELYIQASTPYVGPLVQHECSQSPLWP